MSSRYQSSSKPARSSMEAVMSLSQDSSFIAVKALPRAIQDYVAGKLISVEEDCVNIAILNEKRKKLEAIVEGDREVPRELKANRVPPSLGPHFQFSASIRREAEELCRKQDHEYVELLLSDLYKITEQAYTSLEVTIEESGQAIKNKVTAKQKEAAEFLFNKMTMDYVADMESLLAKRRPGKRKRQSTQSPRKRSRIDGKKSHHSRRKPASRKQ